MGDEFTSYRPGLYSSHRAASSERRRPQSRSTSTGAMSTMARRSRSLGDRAAARMASIASSSASSSSAGGPDVETALRTTGLLTAGRNPGDRTDPVCQLLTTDCNNATSEGQIPTARQRTLWENVQQAKLKGLSFRATARKLGIHRNTVR